MVEIARSRVERNVEGKNAVYNFASAVIQLDHQEITENYETVSSDSESHDVADVVIHKHLEEVDLRSNKLKGVPNFLFNIPTLKRLNLSFNKITSLPASMWSCSSLIELNASHNLLPELPYPSDLPLTFCKDCNVREMSSSRLDSLSSNDSAVLFDGDGPNGSIFVDELCYSRINHWEDKVKVQPPFFADDDDEDVFKTTSHLRELDLSFNLFEEVPLGLPCLAYRLEKLLLSNNQITRFGSVQSYPISLEVLDLSRNQISEEHQIRRMSSVLPSPSISTGIPRICKSPMTKISLTKLVLCFGNVDYNLLTIQL